MAIDSSAGTDDPSTPFSTTLRWCGGERFEGTVDGTPVTLDGSSRTDLSPMQSVLAALGACMGIDIAMILEKGRAPLKSLVVEVQGYRAASPPRRFTRYQMSVKVSGAIEPAKVQRAVDLSRDKYCSVWHTLGQDAPLEISIEVE